jgi:hypothetical protein
MAARGQDSAALEIGAAVVGALIVLSVVVGIVSAVLVGRTAYLWCNKEPLERLIYFFWGSAAYLVAWPAALMAVAFWMDREDPRKSAPIEE